MKVAIAVGFLAIVGSLLIWRVLYPNDNPISNLLSEPEVEEHFQPQERKSYTKKTPPPVFDPQAISTASGIVICNAMYDFVETACK